MPHTREVRMAKRITCGFCPTIARYDGKTLDGPWAYMCERHFREQQGTLGLGRGQRLIYPGETE